MTDEKGKTVGQEPSVLPSPSVGPLIFISHDSRDAELAEAFSKLLKSISSGMLKSFRSSDRKGTEGIEFGDEWYKRLVEKLQAASDVVCLFTERSLERPWILYEAGIAKANLDIDTRVLGIALGVSLSKVSTGPFYHFQNCDDSEELLIKLVRQLACRVPGADPDTDVIKNQVQTFKATTKKILDKLSDRSGKEVTAIEDPVAKFLEEMKGLVRDLPSRVADRVVEVGDPMRRRKFRRFHPMMMEDIMHASGDPSDPIGLLMAASLVRDEMPWFYEIATEAYHAIKAGDAQSVEREIKRLHHFPEFLMRGPFDEFGGKEAHMMMIEFPRMFKHMLQRCLEVKKPPTRRRSTEISKES
ncbi:toll/interleukin-1 receptor domain-containing protein [Candidatus Woesearchaeota archaeon]|nr:toll/interleukin-1 receptor domain-containing protein [Candidatus Woesearchaeota archaeon]